MQAAVVHFAHLAVSAYSGYWIRYSILWSQAEVSTRRPGYRGGRAVLAACLRPSARREGAALTSQPDPRVLRVQLPLVRDWQVSRSGLRKRQSRTAPVIPPSHPRIAMHPSLRPAP
jgi:hypothetical protein